jgi:hypothetical protein
MKTKTEAFTANLPFLFPSCFPEFPVFLLKLPSPRIDAPSVRRRIFTVLTRLSLLLVLIALLAPLRAQDEPVHMRPEFPLIFPLDQNGKDVTVKFPVLLNPGTVLKPGMVLHIIYVMNTVNPDGSTDLVLAHKGNADQAYARTAGGDSGANGAKMSPEVAHEIEGYRRTIWEVSNNFVLAMAQYPTDSMHLIYKLPGKDQDLKDERFGFFDGLFVGLPNGKVTVLAVEKESKSEAAGIKAGDEILSVGGFSTQNDLATFASDYATAKRIAKENEIATYPLVIRSEGGTDTHTANVPMPPRIRGGLMDDFK